MGKSFEIKDLHVTRDGREIVRGVSLKVPAGEVHAIMGPNGSGKSSLANAVMGHPKYAVSAGNVLIDGEDITDAPPDERSRKGLFLSMQYPPEVPGVTVSGFIREAVNSRLGKPVSVPEFREKLAAEMEKFEIGPEFAGRGLNEGFSGGEKKCMEILQMAMLEPKYAVLDETDSGLDVDALKAVTNGIKRAQEAGAGVLLITHYTRILQYLVPDKVYVMAQGKIVKSGGKDLAHEIEEKGYAPIICGRQDCEGCPAARPVRE